MTLFRCYLYSKIMKTIRRVVIGLSTKLKIFAKFLAIRIDCSQIEMICGYSKIVLPTIGDVGENQEDWVKRI